MILHLLRMRRNVNRNVFNDRENVSATPSLTVQVGRGRRLQQQPVGDEAASSGLVG